MGIINETSCKALIYNYGLFTQCEHIPIENDSLCPSCKKHNAKLGTLYDRNKPNYNDDYIFTNIEIYMLNNDNTETKYDLEKNLFPNPNKLYYDSSDSSDEEGEHVIETF